ncbi:hypothetical protein HMPREF8577_2059 [Streptococcus parasanguinis ATCC 903]|nr:hypothetical protein HMPREF8577_2059 [Streptococcus parasanguinis ATCC 903]
MSYLCYNRNLKKKRTNSEFARVVEESTDINSGFVARKQRKNLAFRAQKVVAILEVTSFFIANASRI